ncbi:ribonuclease Z [Isoptericola variabilis]|uniref:Ribonuclease Z n=1 Tax=Isoptericola variabilis (strain 225) TaxID=743718 RepID=F6FUX1_ISOV2|nr:ribonuclease Z [Isoptericola variabilis]AEG44311.1 Ribonuclease Z [Isoptericola variabilis 225]TWH31101.1 ribonuclease Z [Isoptericola variabilis J7]
MSARELVVLGTASMVPTRERNHNGYVLRFDDTTILFDPGEGTQRQLTLAGISATDLTRIAITHLHGDHSLGLAGVAQRISGDQVPHVVPVCFPASGERWVRHLLDASAFDHHERVVLQPLTAAPGEAVPVPAVPGQRGGSTAGAPTLTARPLEHRIDALGYRLQEPDGVTLDPALLAAAGVAPGPDVGRLQREGVLALEDARVVRLEQVSVHRPGQSVAFVMDTRMCDSVGELADGVDLLVIESTFLHRDADLAERWAHLTARQAAIVAAEAGARHLVLTHFSQRYRVPDELPQAFEREAREVFDGGLTVARDLDRVPLPPRRRRPARP